MFNNDLMRKFSGDLTPWNKNYKVWWHQIFPF